MRRRKSQAGGCFLTPVCCMCFHPEGLFFFFFFLQSNQRGVEQNAGEGVWLHELT